MKFACPNCSQRLEVEDISTAEKVNCPICCNTITVTSDGRIRIEKIPAEKKSCNIEEINEEHKDEAVPHKNENASKMQQDNATANSDGCAGVGCLVLGILLLCVALWCIAQGNIPGGVKFLWWIAFIPGAIGLAAIRIAWGIFQGTEKKAPSNATEGEEILKNSDPDAELSKLRIFAGKDAVRFGLQEGNLWYCVCGKENSFDSNKGVQNCSKCHRNRDYVLSQCSRDSIMGGKSG